jgi:penicillin-binding protein 1A
VGQAVGIDAVKSEAQMAGITSPIPEVPSIFIGSSEVSPLEITAAYAVYANLGRRVKPIAIVRVEDRNGKTLYRDEPASTQVMDAAHAWLMLSGLKDVVLRGTAYSAVSGAGFTFPAAGKTGTTNDGMDAWFIGFTPDLITGVWVGFDKKQVIMSNAQGSLLAAPAWTAAMKAIYERLPRPWGWPTPEGIESVEIDRSTGYLATGYCPPPERVIEHYYFGTAPTISCPLHGGGHTTSSGIYSHERHQPPRQPRTPR